MNLQENKQQESRGNGSDLGVQHFGTETRESTGTRDQPSAAIMANLKDKVSDLQDQKIDPQQHREGVVARTIEQQTAKLPSDTFLWAAVGAMGVSAVCEFSGWKDKSRFFGQWVAPLLLFGVYNKLVKTQGHDQVS